MSQKGQRRGNQSSDFESSKDRFSCSVSPGVLYPISYHPPSLLPSSSSPPLPTPTPLLFTSTIQFQSTTIHHYSLPITHYPNPPLTIINYQLCTTIILQPSLANLITFLQLSAITYTQPPLFITLGVCSASTDLDVTGRLNSSFQTIEAWDCGVCILKDPRSLTDIQHVIRVALVNIWEVQSLLETGFAWCQSHSKVFLRFIIWGISGREHAP